MYQANGTYYTEKHSISFGNLATVNSDTEFVPIANTWMDWHLIPSSRPAIAHPSIVTKFIEVPGSDGMLDLTDYLTGKALYGQRQGSISFVVANDFEHWETIRQNITKTLHGKKLKMVLQDDPEYYYEGRFTVGNWESGADHSSISITYNLEPYKIRIHPEGSDNPVIWDTFNFETDYDYSVMSPTIDVNGDVKTFDIYAYDYTFKPTAYWVSGLVNVSFGNTTRAMKADFTEAELGPSSPGHNILRVAGTGSVKVKWRGGSL